MAITNLKKGSILFINGIDVSKPAEYIDSQSVRNSENFEIKRGLLTKRVGSTQLGDVIGGTGVEIMGGRQLTREDVDYNIRIGLDKIERYNTGTSAWVDITGSDLTGTTTDLVDTAVPLLSGKRILCFTNGVDAIRKWNASGNTADLGGSPPICKYIQEYKTYLVCANIAGGTDISQRVQWSDTADPETWTGGNSGTVDLIEDGGDITGLGLFGNYLCVHKDKSIYLGYLVSSTAIFKFNRIATGVGAVAHNTIINLPTGEQIFLAKDGIRLFNGTTAPLIDAPINDEIRDTINAEYANKAWGVLVREKDEVWIGIPLGSNTTGDTVYKFNYITRTVLKDTRSNISVAWLGNASAGLTWDEMTLAWDSSIDRWDGTGLTAASEKVNLSDSSGYTYIVDSSATNDDGNAITAQFITKDYQHSQDSLARWMQLELWAKGGTIKVEYSTDQGDSWTEMSQSPFTLTDVYPPETSPDIFYFDTVSSTIRFRFSNNASDESLSIKQFIIGYKPREFRR